MDSVSVFFFFSFQNLQMCVNCLLASFSYLVIERRVYGIILPRESLIHHMCVFDIFKTYNQSSIQFSPFTLT